MVYAYSFPASNSENQVKEINSLNYRPPNDGDLREAIRELQEAVRFAGTQRTPMQWDSLITLLVYIRFLEDQLSHLTEQYQGVPTEYFNYIRKEQLQVKHLGVSRPWSSIDTGKTGSTSSKLFPISDERDPLIP